MSANYTEPQDTMSYVEDSSFQYTEHQQESQQPVFHPAN